jgi:hypothetical protein
VKGKEIDQKMLARPNVETLHIEENKGERRKEKPTQRRCGEE